MKAGGIVLCGGRSTRMGEPKATLPFGPETMLQRVVRLLSTVVAPIVAVAAREQILPELPANIIITRDEREQRGPLEGVASGTEGSAGFRGYCVCDQLRRASAGPGFRVANDRVDG